MLMDFYTSVLQLFVPLFLCLFLFVNFLKCKLIIFLDRRTFGPNNNNLVQKCFASCFFNFL